MNFKKITSSFLFILCCYFASAQCPSCTPAFVGCKAAGGLCGSTPVGMANKPYSGNLNFFMPKKLSDPTTLAQCSGCSYVKLRHIKITGIGGLPIGMNYSFNKPNANYKGYYDVENNDTLGCASFCGTPILAGVYPIKVFLLADVTAISTPIGDVSRDDQSQVYLDTLTILADTSGGVSSFTFGNQGKFDCDSLLVPFAAILNAPAPNPTSYHWDFGNGNTSDLKNPPAQLYTGKGVYTAKLTTTYYNYRVKKVFINSTSGWSDVCDIACAGTPPDIYLDFSGLGFNNKANEQSSCAPNLFNNLNIIVPIGTASTSFTIWDDDAAAIPVCGGDDNLGTHLLTINSGQYPLQVNFAGTNSAGYVEFDTVAGTKIVDSIKLEIYGFPATPSVVSVRDSSCDGDSILLNINPTYGNATYAWFKNDTNVIVGADSAFYQAKQEAKYKVIVTDGGTGCAVTSLNKEVFFGTAAPAQVFIYFDQGTQKYFLNPFPVGFKAKWFFNGNEVQGETTQLLPDLGPGIYGAYEYNPSFTFCGVNAANDTVTVNGIFDSKTTEINNFSLFPNPNKGKFTVKGFTANDGEISLQVSDMIGRQIMQKMITPINGEFKETLDLSDANKGVYFVTLQSKTEKTNAKVVIE